MCVSIAEGFADGPGQEQQGKLVEGQERTRRALQWEGFLRQGIVQPRILWQGIVLIGITLLRLAGSTIAQFQRQGEGLLRIERLLEVQQAAIWRQEEAVHRHHPQRGRATTGECSAATP